MKEIYYAFPIATSNYSNNMVAIGDDGESNDHCGRLWLLGRSNSHKLIYIINQKLTLNSLRKLLV